jgi:Polyketide cyclase / dehydrase and lipid transport
LRRNRSVFAVHELRTAIDIDATAEDVWSVLADFSTYEHWNPFIRRIEGSALARGSIEIRVQPSGTKGMTFRPKLRCLWASRFRSFAAGSSGTRSAGLPK